MKPLVMEQCPTRTNESELLKMMYAIHKREDVSLCSTWNYGNALCAQSCAVLLQTVIGLFIKLQMAFSIFVHFANRRVGTRFQITLHIHTV